MQPIHSVTHEEIAERARAIWEKCGHPDGCDVEHWLRAERELVKERQQAEEFRAGLSGAQPKPPTAARPGQWERLPPRH